MIVNPYDLAEPAPAAPQSKSTAARQRPPIAPQPPAPRLPPAEPQTPARAPPPPRLSTIITRDASPLGSPGGPLTALKLAPLEELTSRSTRPSCTSASGRSRRRVRVAAELARDLAGVEAGARVLVEINADSRLYDDEGADEDSGGVGQKLVDVRRELEVLRASMYWGWTRCMWIWRRTRFGYGWKLMERSLADMMGLGEEGLRLQDPRVIARFASDILQALMFLRKHRIAPREHSNHLLLNGEGVLKLSHARVAVFPSASRTGRRRSGSYNAPKVDVWSVGATVLGARRGARAVLRHGAALYPSAFHEFSRLCFKPAEARVAPGALLEFPAALPHLQASTSGVNQGLNDFQVRPGADPSSRPRVVQALAREHEALAREYFKHWLTIPLLYFLRWPSLISFRQEHTASDLVFRAVLSLSIPHAPNDHVQAAVSRGGAKIDDLRARLAKYEAERPHKIRPFTHTILKNIILAAYKYHPRPYMHLRRFGVRAGQVPPLLLDIQLAKLRGGWCGGRRRNQPGERVDVEIFSLRSRSWEGMDDDLRTNGRNDVQALLGVGEEPRKREPGPALLACGSSRLFSAVALLEDAHSTQYW
ncbi:hypothetical protein C8J57DRAFT_1468177 [Mycena rebaudengoi]|nr:hypothetical protein C8J57DRAFT_1468177 [Mycena rebaudengoi]